METIVAMKLTDIFANFKQNSRINYDAGKLKELAESIRRDGLSHPLTIRKANGEDETKRPFVLIAGYRRYKAMMEILGMEECTVNLTEAVGAEAAIFSLNENLAREDISTYEKARGLVMVRDEFKVGPKEISKRLCGNDVETGKAGFKPQTIGNLMRIWDKLDPRIAEEWKNGHPKATTLALLNIIREDDGDTQFQKWLTRYIGQEIHEADKDDDADEGEDGDDEAAGSGASRPTRPNVHKIAGAIEAVRESSHDPKWIEGAIIALEWAAGLRKRLPGVNLNAKKDKKDKKSTKNTKKEE